MPIYRSIKNFVLNKVLDNLMPATTQHRRYITVDTAPDTIYASLASCPTTDSAPSSFHSRRSRADTPTSMPFYNAIEQSNPTLRLSTQNLNLGAVYISSRPVSGLQSFPVLQYTFLKADNLHDEKRVEREIGAANVKILMQVYDLLLRDLVAGAMIKTAIVKPNRKGTVNEWLANVNLAESVVGPVEYMYSAGLQRNPLNSPGVEDFFENMEESTLDVRTHPRYSTPSALRPTPAIGTTSSNPHPLLDTPFEQMVIVIDRETREVYVRKIDGKVYRVKVRRMPGEQEKDDRKKEAEEKGWVFVEDHGDRDDREARQITTRVERREVFEDGWDDCKV